jgi:hypothetical protein
MKIPTIYSGLCIAILLTGSLLVLHSCASGSEGAPNGSTFVDKDSLLLTTRTNVDTQAVASYEEKLNNKLNNWYFSVRVYETKKPLDYIVQLGYEEMEYADTISFPDLGSNIKPAVQKGPDSLSCYVGFIDPKGQFQYYKGVYVDQHGINIRTIRTYNKE